MVPARLPPPAGGSMAASRRPFGLDNRNTEAGGSPTEVPSRPRSSAPSPLSLSVSRLRPVPELGARPEVERCWRPRCYYYYIFWLVLLGIIDFLCCYLASRVSLLSNGKESKEGFIRKQEDANGCVSCCLRLSPLFFFLLFQVEYVFV